MSKEVKNNVFNDGLTTDSAIYATPDNVYTYAENVTFVSHNGNELILQNEKGTLLRSELKQNYHPIAWKTYGNVCYIISAESINGVFTGRGEIGSYPSPDYDNYTLESCIGGNDVDNCSRLGEMVNRYQPFKNYKDGDNKIGSYGDFNTDLFNFKETNHCEIVAIQPSYDGSVNVIFTDNYNKPRLINSGFSVMPNNRYVMVNRIGATDDNRYEASDFDSNLNHIITSNRLGWIEFLGQDNSGRLPVGTYTYYIRYSTRDGNLTDVICQSFSIPVFFGNTVADIRGGVPNELTTKANQLVFHNIDPDYYALKLYYTYVSGQDVEPQPSLFEVQQEIVIDGKTEVSYTHRGTEIANQININNLSLTTSNILTYRTGAELQGRLFVGNIKTAGFDYNELKKFSNKVTIDYAQKRLGVKGATFDNVISDIYDPITSGAGFDGYPSGYANPRNVHDRLGYWPGEPYMFGIQYMFKNGSLSPVFPIRGIDNIYNDASYNMSDLSGDIDYDERNNYENVRGIYRFPLRSYLNKILENGSVGIIHPIFNIPEVSDYIKENTVGFRIHRAKERKRDAISSGIIINTFIIPENDYVDTSYKKMGNGDGGGELTTYNNIPDQSKRGYSELNSKFIPAPEYILESAGIYKANQSNNGRQINRTDTIYSYSVEAVKFLMNNNNYVRDLNNAAYPQNASIPLYINKRYAFISPDFMGEKGIFSQRLSGRDKGLLVYENSQFVYSVTQPNIAGSRNMDSFEDFESGISRGDFEPLPSMFSLYKEVSTNTRTLTIKSAELEFIDKDSSTVTKNRFTGRALFQAFNKVMFATGNRDRSGAYSYHPLSYNDYVGVTIDTSNENLLSPFNGYNNSFYSSRVGNAESGFFISSKSDTPNEEYEMFGASVKTTRRVVAAHANIYPRFGPVDGKALIDTHLPEAEDYMPITHWTYWNQQSISENQGSASSQVLTNGKIEGYNGDNFVSITFRRLYKNQLDPLVNDGNLSRYVRLGPTISFASDSNVNINIRNQQIFDVAEGIREWAPYYTKPNPPYEQIEWTGNKNTWRQYQFLESDNYNTGYNRVKGDTIYKSLGNRIPFIQTDFSTRIQYSELFVSKSFDNGYRRFSGLNYRDYPNHVGDIVAIRPYNGQGLIVVFSHGVAMIPVNQRIAQTGDSAGAVFFQSAGVLPPEGAINYLSERYGSRWQASVVASDNTVYGVDIDRSKIWRVGGNQLELISDLRVQKYLRSISEKFIDVPDVYQTTQIRATYDTFKQNIWFSFLADGVSQSLLYNEMPIGRWLSFKPIYPDIMFNIRDEIYGIKDSLIYQHYVSEDHSNYYGNQYDTVIEFVASLDAQTQVIIDNLIIIGNHIYPHTIEYTTDSGTYIQTIRPRNVVDNGSKPFLQNPANSLFTYDAVYKEDRMYITVIKDESDTRKLSNFINRRIRDKYCKIRITYKTNQYLYIKNILTLMRRSDA
jgi:hypothetical protein